MKKLGVVTVTVAVVLMAALLVVWALKYYRPRPCNCDDDDPARTPDRHPQPVDQLVDQVDQVDPAAAAA